MKEFRICSKCGDAMDEGFVYDGETYCCETCLPISKAQFDSEYVDGGDDYWTQWEDCYLD